MCTSSKIYEPQGDYHGNCTAKEKRFIYMGVCACVCVLDKKRYVNRRNGGGEEERLAM